MLVYNTMVKVRHASQNFLMEGKTGWAVGTLCQDEQQVNISVIVYHTVLYPQQDWFTLQKQTCLTIITVITNTKLYAVTDNTNIDLYSPPKQKKHKF